MAKKKNNSLCEECKNPFHADTRWNTCCSTKCRIDYFKKIKAKRDKS